MIIWNTKVILIAALCTALGGCIEQEANIEEIQQNIEVNEADLATLKNIKGFERTTQVIQEE